MSQPAGARRAKIRHSRCSTGWTPNRPTLTAAFNNERRYTTGEVVCVWHRKKENERRKLRKTELKREGKTLSHSASCLRKGRGWRHLVLSHSQTVETSAIFNIKCTGGVESCPAHWIQSSASGQPSECALLCAAEGRRKKEEGAEEGKKTCLFVWGGLSRKVILWLFEFASKARLFPPTGSHISSTLRLLRLYARVTYERASPAGEQRHPGFSWWWELTSDWFPWILMWRIVCFIEEQKEARWLPFRIC